MTKRPGGLLRWKSFRLSPELTISIAVVVVWRVCLEMINHILVPLINYPPNLFGTGGIKDGFANWIHWDGSWYLYVVQAGYHYYYANPQVSQNIVFFPGYPLGVRIVHDVTGIGFPYAGLLLNILICIAIVFVTQKLYKLFKAKNLKRKNSKTDNDHGFLVIALIFSFPTAFFLAAFYADALLLLLFLCAIYFALKNKYLLAAILAGAATGCKITGIVAAVTVMAIFVEQHLRNNEFFHQKTQVMAKFVGLSLLSVWGILLYMAYLYEKFHNAFVFYTDESAWPGKNQGNAISNIWLQNYAHIFEPRYFGDHMSYLVALTDMAVPLLAVLLLAYFAYKKLI